MRAGANRMAAGEHGQILLIRPARELSRSFDRCYAPAFRPVNEFAAARSVLEAIAQEARNAGQGPDRQTRGATGVQGVVAADQRLADEPRPDEPERLGREDPLSAAHERKTGQRVLRIVDQGGQDAARQPRRPCPVAGEAVGVVNAPAVP